MSNGYELTDVRIDEIITRSLSRYRGIVQPATSATAPTKTASYFKPPGGSTGKHATGLYKKYGDNEDNENETNDNVLLHGDTSANQCEDAAIFADSAKTPKKKIKSRYKVLSARHPHVRHVQSTVLVLLYCTQRHVRLRHDG